MDFPGELKVHQSPIPRFGGMAIWGGTVLGCAASVAIAGGPGRPQFLPVALAGATAMALIGAADDIRGLTPKTRFGLGLAVAVAVSGLAAGWGDHSPGTVGLLVVPLALWLLGNANAMNMLDGLDGLAAGVAGIAGVGLAAVGVQAGSWPCVCLGASAAGACFGFLPFNFRPASVFMGDVGSLFLGFSLAAGVVILIAGEERPGTPVIAGALLPLGLPVSDMLLAMTRRRLSHKPMFRGDRSHLYDQLRDRFGLGVRTVVLTCYSIAVVFAGLAFWVSQMSGSAAVAATLAVVGLAAATLLLGGFLSTERDAS